jgi:hypothetical protein
MLPYWIAFLIAATGALTERSRLPALGLQTQRPRGLNGAWWLVAVGLALFIGLRHEVGGDWGNYLNNLSEFDERSFKDTLALSPIQLLQSDPGYRLLEWLASELGLGIYLVNTIGGALFAFGLVRFCRELPHPWLALLVSIPYLVIVVALGYTRQAIALGFVMLAFNAFVRASVVKACVYVLLGALFHKSAFALIPLLILIGKGSTLVRLTVASGVIVAATSLIYTESLLAFSSGYIEAAYQSEGALVRLAMNALPALLLLFRCRRFPLTPLARALWVSLAYLALAALLLYFVFPSSTAIDRVALYLIPLQLVVFAYVPLVYGGTRHGIFLRVSLTLYLASVMAVWLFFATYAYKWLPYHSAIFLPFWN